jgi:RimJ/RimL family protein N-acetyltransferase
MKSGEVTIRPWQGGDFALLAAAAPRLSERTLRLRFWGSFPTLPPTYLRSTERRWPYAWDAVAALDGDELVGWAEYGRYPDDLRNADLAVCVVDDEQGHGIGTALAAALLERARGAGLRSVHVDIAPFNQAALHTWLAVSGSRASTLALAG